MPTRRDVETGSAAVEFALVLPLVLVVILGLVQVGVFARDRVLVEAAARAGARAAALADDPSAVTSAAQAASPGLDTGALSVTTSRAGSRGDPVTVSVVYVDPVRVPLVGWLVGGAVSMTADATLRQEFG
ncbi:MAG TPA: TadE/TadG family type IV pilus assembly protein [Actinomycetota bacterium]|nr:TadE/TadG family type IV pilus assembly protein [Actinomycetota bacterium]